MNKFFFVTLFLTSSVFGSDHYEWSATVSKNNNLWSIWGNFTGLTLGADEYSEYIQTNDIVYKDGGGTTGTRAFPNQILNEAGIALVSRPWYSEWPNHNIRVRFKDNSTDKYIPLSDIPDGAQFGLTLFINETSKYDPNGQNKAPSEKKEHEPRDK